MFSRSAFFILMTFLQCLGEMCIHVCAANACVCRCRCVWSTDDNLQWDSPGAKHIWVGWYVCMFLYVCVNIPWYTCGSHRTTCMSWFSSFTVWVPGIELWCQAWWQVPLPTELSCLPSFVVLRWMSQCVAQASLDSYPPISASPVLELQGWASNPHLKEF